MMAVKEGDTIIVAKDFVAAVTLKEDQGYKVEVHVIGKPYTRAKFIVDAETGDKACAIAESVCKQYNIKTCGFTFQKR